jgi:hypothetical protein
MCSGVLLSRSYSQMDAEEVGKVVGGGGRKGEREQEEVEDRGGEDGSAGEEECVGGSVAVPCRKLVER